jgi:hypothetical protein
MEGFFENNKDSFVAEIIEVLEGLHKDEKVELLNEVIRLQKAGGNFKEINISDGYHTFDELYEFRKMYNAVLFSGWAEAHLSSISLVDSKVYDKVLIEPKYNVHKSWKHYDGEPCFGGGWFIVSAMLPTGLISNHYKAEDWDLFRVPEVDKALYEFDGHTGKDVLSRLQELI